jgi:hypothetical protein
MSTGKPGVIGRMWLPSLAAPLEFCSLGDPELDARTLNAMIMLAQCTGLRCEPGMKGERGGDDRQ